MAMSSIGNSISIIDPKTLAEKEAITGHTGPIRSFGFSLKNDLLISSSADKTAVVWKVGFSIES